MFNIGNVKVYFVYWLKIHERRTIVVAPSALYTRIKMWACAHNSLMVFCFRIEF